MRAALHRRIHNHATTASINTPYSARAVVLFHRQVEHNCRLPPCLLRASSQLANVCCFCRLAVCVGLEVEGQRCRLRDLPEPFRRMLPGVQGAWRRLPAGVGHLQSRLPPALHREMAREPECRTAAVSVVPQRMGLPQLTRPAVPHGCSTNRWMRAVCAHASATTCSIWTTVALVFVFI